MRADRENRAVGGAAQITDRSDFGSEPVAWAPRDPVLARASSIGWSSVILSLMDRRLLPVALGLGTGIVQFALPDALGMLVVVVAALAAGWLLPEAPMQAALLFLVPSVVFGAVRVLLDGEAPVGTLLFGLVLAAMFTAVCTHVGAGIALRRRAAEQS